MANPRTGMGPGGRPPAPKRSEERRGETPTEMNMRVPSPRGNRKDRLAIVLFSLDRPAGSALSAVLRLHRVPVHREYYSHREVDAAEPESLGGVLLVAYVRGEQDLESVDRTCRSLRSQAAVVFLAREDAARLREKMPSCVRLLVELSTQPESVAEQIRAFAGRG
jgi:hypothetical protein